MIPARVLVAAILFAMAACGGEPAIERGPLVVGLLPDEAAATQQARYAGLLAHLRDRTGLEVRVAQASSYDDLLRLFAEGRVDLAYFGGYTFVTAWREQGAVPLVMRDTDLDFTSGFIAHVDDDRSTIDEFAGGSFSFASHLSTSGHLMPRHFLVSWGIDPESHFARVTYSGAHDRTIADVAARRVDLGAVNMLILREHLAASEPPPVRLLKETPPYPDYVWAVAASMDPGLRNVLKDAFLELSPLEPGQAAVLRDMGAGGFLPASPADFQTLAAIIDRLRHD